MKWTDCKDKQPRDRKRVICYDPAIAKHDKAAGTECPGVRFGRRIEALNENNPEGCMGYNFTHWMPVPKPPKALDG